MNSSEVARLLGAASAFDRRTVGDADVVAWQAVLDDVPFADALEAVKRHYRDGEAWLMPVHVRRGAAEIARERERAARATGWAPGQAGVPKDQALPSISSAAWTNVADLSPEVQALVESVRAFLPEGSREALMPRRVAWEREHAAWQRYQSAVPNPNYRPQTLADLCPGTFDCRPEKPCGAVSHWWADPEDAGHGPG